MSLEELYTWMSQPYPKPVLITKNKPICVTGASGYVAGHIIQQLINEGYTVHGTVRNKDKPAAHLSSLDTVGGKLILFSADLLNEGSYDEATAGCDCVIHTASPFVMDIKDPQKDLVDPAVKGTLNVLNSCLRNGVKKVVLTSSCAAVTDQGVQGKVFTEADFNTKSSLYRNPYYFSKIQAELAAWNFAKENPSIHLVVINPFAVIGPSHLKTVGESAELVLQLTKGQVPAIINLGYGVVDVRDVAVAHIRAMERPDACGRYICSSETINVEYIANVVRESFPEYANKLPKYNLTGAVGCWLAYTMAWFRPKGVRDFLQTNVGRPIYVDNTRIKSHLGISLRPAKESIIATVQDFQHHGLLPAVKKSTSSS